MKSRLLKMFSIFFAAGCVTGVTYQILLVAKSYFCYRTTTEIKISIPKIVKTQGSITLCTRYVDHLDFERIRAASPGNTRSDWHYSHEASWIRKYQHELTIDEIFKYTPDARTTLTKVVSRLSDSYESNETNGAAVYEQFDIEKFLYLEYLCYEYFVKNGQKLTYSSLAVTPASSGQIISLYINSSLEKANMLKIAIHSKHSRPYRSLMFTPVQRRNYDPVEGVAKYNHFSSFFTSLRTFNLPPPYDTQCFQFQQIKVSSATECVEECVRRNVVLKLNKVPFSSIINSSIDLKMISYLDVSRPETAKTISEIQKMCEKGICSQKSCKDYTDMTTTTERIYSKFVIRIIVPPYPSVRVKANPALKLVEFLTQIMSVISTWTGISVMSINPRTFFVKKKSRFSYTTPLTSASRIELLARLFRQDFPSSIMTNRRSRVKPIVQEPQNLVIDCSLKGSI